MAASAEAHSVDITKPAKLCFPGKFVSLMEADFATLVQNTWARCVCVCGGVSGSSLLEGVGTWAEGAGLGKQPPYCLEHGVPPPRQPSEPLRAYGVVLW